MEYLLHVLSSLWSYVVYKLEYVKYLATNNGDLFN